MSSSRKNLLSLPFKSNLKYLIKILHNTLKENTHKIGHNFLGKANTYIRQEAELQESYSNVLTHGNEHFRMQHDLNIADKIAKSNPKMGLESYEWIYRQYNSTRALFGIGKLSNILAIKMLKSWKAAGGGEAKAEKNLEEIITNLYNKSVDSMCKIIQTRHALHAPMSLYLQAGQFCLENSRKSEFINFTNETLIMPTQGFPSDRSFGFIVGLDLLLQLRLSMAEKVLRHFLHAFKDLNVISESLLLGVCLKLQKYHKIPVKENNDEVSSLLEVALEDEPHALSIFVFIGEHYNRLGRFNESEVVFDEGVRIGLFLSKWQRSGVEKHRRLQHLRGRPIWNLNQTGYHEGLEKIKSSYRVIRNEGMSALFGAKRNFGNSSKTLKDKGRWEQLALFEFGHVNERGCKLAPRTCYLISKYMKEISAECAHCQVKFSVVYSGTHVWPHTGPSFYRIRAHLGLVIPNVTGNERLEIRIADKYIHWTEGEFLIIDDSFEHELWYEKETDEVRLLLLIDMWHPDLTEEDRKNILPLYEL